VQKIIIRTPIWQKIQAEVDSFAATSVVNARLKIIKRKSGIQESIKT